MFTSLFLGGPVPFKAGMKMMSDFEKINWFQDFPETDGIPFSGYYWGANASDITLNSFDSDKPLMVNGVVENSQGYVTVSRDNYLNTQYKAPVALTVAGVMRRTAAGGTLNTYAVADFSGAGANAHGFGIAAASDGRLLVARQNAGTSSPSYAYASFPESIRVGDFFAFTSFIRQGTITVAIYDPSTGKYVSSASSVPGDITAGDKNILIGCKTDNNNSALSSDIKSVVLINGSLTADQHIAVQKYLLEMA
ncbi:MULTISPECIES: hypothetical protein [Raoultella]|uniref:hypothetical protein n=1 Tax=Raoultella TaxID=160674 RepID=UPI00225B154F|nr:hypothetical protein [Raoultella sp. DY2415]EKR9381695.1 hypothetical protein [Raoultella ornithinolytica]